jgi:mannosyltransferase
MLYRSTKAQKIKLFVKLSLLYRRILQGSGNAHSTKFLTRGCAIALFLIALLFNLYLLGVPGIWFDEAFSVELARQPLPLLLHIIFGPEPNMELYYLMLHFWLSFNSWLGIPPVEFLVRFPSALFAAIATLLVFLLGKRFLDFGTGLLGAILFLLNIQQLTYAQQARSYSLQMLLLCAGWYALFSALTAKEKRSVQRWWCGYTIAMVLAIYAHLFSGFILLSQVVAVIGIALIPNAWRDCVRSRWVGFVISLCLVGLGCIFLVPAILGGNKTGWLPVPQWHDFYHLFDTISGHELPYLVIYTLFCATSIGLLILRWMTSSRFLAGSNHRKWGDVVGRWLVPEQAWPIIWSLCCWLLLPIGTSYVVSQTVLRLYSARYLVTIVPPFFLLISACVARIPQQRIRMLAVLLCLVLAIPPVFYYYANAQIEDWNRATRWVQARYQDGDGLLCYDSEPSQGCQISVEYYLETYPTGAHFTSDTPGAFSWAQLGPANPAEGFDSVLDPNVIARFATQHKRFFYIVGRVPSLEDQQRVDMTQKWLIAHYRHIAHLTTPTVTVDFYTT